MDFNTILDRITKKVQKCTPFTEEQIKEALEVYKDNRFDFMLHFNKLSSTPEETAKSVFEALKAANLEEIKDLCFGTTSISFNLNKKMFFKDILQSIHEKDADFGKNNIGGGKVVIVEYSSPNIAKMFHVGHYRTTILGNFIKNLLNVSGYKTISMNYLGDWGKQFGLVLLGYERFGSEEKLKEDPLVHLFDVYVKINAEAKEHPTLHENAKNIFREMEEFENEKHMALWRYFREISIEKYTELYKKLNVAFDIYSGESFYYKTAKAFAMETTLAVTDEDGSKYIDCDVASKPEDDAKYGKALIMKSDGTTLYLTRDICAAMDRVELYNPAKIIYVVSSEQNLHLQQLFKCMELLKYDKNIFQHINFGYVTGMSTRNGTVHFLEDIIQSSAEAIKSRLLNNKNISCEDRETTATTLAISTLLVADFSSKRVKGYTFDYDKRANCEKGSGAYLQYAHCRLNSIEEMNAENVVKDVSSVDFDLIDNPDVHELAYKLMWYERTIEQCLAEYEPSKLVLYLMDLCKAINNVVGKLRVKGETPEVAQARLLVFSSSRKVLRNGLEVLGITPLNKM